MAVSLAYMDDLSRVRLDATDFPADADAVHVERSTDQIRWTTVRGAATWDTEIVGSETDFTQPLDDYEFTPGVTNYYRCTPIDTGPGDPNFLAGLAVEDTTGHYASTPDTAALDITGNLDLRADLSKNDWSVGVEIDYIVAKYDTDADQRSYALAWTGTSIQLRWSEDGVNVQSVSSDALSFTDGTRHAIRATLVADNGSSQHEIRFYTADTMDSGWTQLGSTVTSSGGTSIFSGSANVTVNGGTDGTLGRWAGTVHEIQVRDGINTTPVAWPIFRKEYESPFTDEAGLDWSTNSAALTIQSASITPTIDRPWLKSVTRPFLNRPVTLTEFGEVERASRNGVFPVVGRSLPVAVTDVRLSREQEITLVTETPAEAKELDFVLAAGDLMFWQAPPGCPVASRHVVIGDTSEARRSTRGPRRYFTLPLVEIAAPDPAIVGVTATWDALIAEYGSWSAVVAAFPDWAAVVEFVGSPESVIVA